MLHSPMTTTLTKCCRVLLWVALLAASIPAFGQQSEIDGIAVQVSEQIVKAGRKKVIVARYFGGKKVPFALGKLLAERLAAALARVANGYQILDWQRLSQLQQERNLMDMDLDTSDLLASVAYSAGAQVVVVGSTKDERDAI